MWFLANDPNALPGEWGWIMRTNTMTSTSGNVVTKPWANPLPAEAALLKCVMNEAEDMSSKTTVGDIYFVLKLGDPVGGTCSSMSSTVSYEDDSYDLKHHVTVEGAANVGGKCVEYTLVNQQVAGSSIMTNTFCYFSENADDWPN